MFHRSTALAVVTFVVGALVPWTPAMAVGENCQGRPATMVGTGPDINGTAGDDVIVSGASGRIDAGAGNDVICVSAFDVPVVVDAGAGDDVVDASATTRGTHTSLGSGIDRFLGSGGPVWTQDLVDGEGADDDVREGAEAGLWVTLNITDPVGTATGTYVNTGAPITVRSRTLAIEVTLDGQIIVAGVPAADIRGFSAANVYAPRAILHGDAEDNVLTVIGCDVQAFGEDGDDEIRARRSELAVDPLQFDCKHTARISGGRGDDDVTGTRGRDTLAGNAGDDYIHGGAGADVLLGGTGSDHLHGERGPDALRGSWGNDRANGGLGRDLCVAETQRRCER